VVERSGKGQVIDIGLYESVFRLLDELVPAYDRNGTIRERMGPEVEYVVPHGHWMSSDGKWIALACSSDKLFSRLAVLIGRPELASPDRFGAVSQRVAGRE